MKKTLTRVNRGENKEIILHSQFLLDYPIQSLSIAR